MKILLILSLAFTAVLAAPAEEKNPFIVGGVNALPGEFPFIVSLQWVLLGASSHVCGGSILSNLWVLSVRTFNSSEGDKSEFKLNFQGRTLPDRSSSIGSH